MIEVLCDGLFVLAVLAVLGGLAMLIRSVVGGFDLMWCLRGLAMLVLGPAMLLLWEKLVWEPSIKNISS